jgi:hypothetical protein
LDGKNEKISLFHLHFHKYVVMENCAALTRLFFENTQGESGQPARRIVRRSDNEGGSFGTGGLGAP